MYKHASLGLLLYLYTIFLSFYLLYYTFIGLYTISCTYTDFDTTDYYEFIRSFLHKNEPTRLIQLISRTSVLLFPNENKRCISESF